MGRAGTPSRPMRWSRSRRRICRASPKAKRRLARIATRSSSTSMRQPSVEGRGARTCRSRPSRGSRATRGWPSSPRTSAASHWASAADSASCRRACDARYGRVTAAARSPDAATRASSTPITCGTGRRAARPAPRTRRCCARAITASCTRARFECAVAATARTSFDGPMGA